MADSAGADQVTEHGFIARNNQVVGSVLSLIALAISVALGAGLMLGTNTRGISAILTVLLIAGSTFSMQLMAISALLRAVTPPEIWDREEQEWRDEMGLDPLTADDADQGRRSRRLAVILAVVALLAGLSLSVLPAAL